MDREWVTKFSLAIILTLVLGPLYWATKYLKIVIFFHQTVFKTAPAAPASEAVTSLMHKSNENILWNADLCKICSKAMIYWYKINENILYTKI